MSKILLSIIAPCFNEEANIGELYARVSMVMDAHPQFDFEFLLIDNASTDGTVEKLRTIAATDRRLKVIVNARNFGHIRSPYWGMLQTKGAATIYLASDLQDPPEMIPEFIRGWEQGYKVVLAVKPHADGSALMHFLRRTYYRMLDSISDVTITRDSTGFGLYDRVVLDQVRAINDPYPYFRGLIDDLGYEKKLIEFSQPRRLRGVTKNNFYTLFDIAMLGIVSHSMVPLRMAAFLGFLFGGLSVVIAFAFLVAKLIWWNWFSVGIAPIIIGMFFMFGVVLIFIGLLGEYVGSIHTYVQRRPVVVERERINFD